MLVDQLKTRTHYSAALAGLELTMWTGLAPASASQELELRGCLIILVSCLWVFVIVCLVWSFPMILDSYKGHSFRVVYILPDFMHSDIFLGVLFA